MTKVKPNFFVTKFTKQEIRYGRLHEIINQIHEITNKIHEITNKIRYITKSSKHCFQFLCTHSYLSVVAILLAG